MCFFISQVNNQSFMQVKDSIGDKKRKNICLIDYGELVIWLLII